MGGAGDGDPPEAVEVWTSFIFGMLSNLGVMSVERIHSTLIMFASVGDYPCECGSSCMVV